LLGVRPLLESSLADHSVIRHSQGSPLFAQDVGSGLKCGQKRHSDIVILLCTTQNWKSNTPALLLFPRKAPAQDGADRQNENHNGRTYLRLASTSGQTALWHFARGVPSHLSDAFFITNQLCCTSLYPGLYNVRTQILCTTP
jgi:hypothetical protein